MQNQFEHHAPTRSAAAQIWDGDGNAFGFYVENTRGNDFNWGFADLVGFDDIVFGTDFGAPVLTLQSTSATMAPEVAALVTMLNEFLKVGIGESDRVVPMQVKKFFEKAEASIDIFLVELAFSGIWQD